MPRGEAGRNSLVALSSDMMNPIEIRGPIMTTVKIELPDQLVREAKRAGLLAPETIEKLLRERLRAERVERLREARRKLATEPLEPMTPEEIQAEIDAYRAEQRRAAGS